jgi:hypothetical protein
MLSVLGIIIQLIGETLRWSQFAFRSRQSTETENLFLRRLLALYVERGAKLRLGRASCDVRRPLPEVCAEAPTRHHQ